MKGLKKYPPRPINVKNIQYRPFLAVSYLHNTVFIMFISAQIALNHVICAHFVNFLRYDKNQWISIKDISAAGEMSVANIWPLSYLMLGIVCYILHPLTHNVDNYEVQLIQKYLWLFFLRWRMVQLVRLGAMFNTLAMWHRYEETAQNMYEPNTIAIR